MNYAYQPLHCLALYLKVRISRNRDAKGKKNPPWSNFHTTEVDGDPLGPLLPGVDTVIEGCFPGSEIILISILRACKCAFLLVLIISVAGSGVFGPDLRLLIRISAFYVRIPHERQSRYSW